MWEIIYEFIKTHGVKITFLCLVLSGFISLICFVFFPDIPKNFDLIGHLADTIYRKREYARARAFFPQVFLITFVVVWAFVIAALYFVFRGEE